MNTSEDDGGEAEAVRCRRARCGRPSHARMTPPTSGNDRVVRDVHQRVVDRPPRDHARRRATQLTPITAAGRRAEQRHREHDREERARDADAPGPRRSATSLPIAEHEQEPDERERLPVAGMREPYGCCPRRPRKSDADARQDERLTSRHDLPVVGTSGNRLDAYRPRTRVKGPDIRPVLGVPS